MSNKAANVGEKQVKVALWSVPRSMSTIMTKCLSAIDGMEVYLELYSYATAVAGSFESSTGRKLPMVFEGNEADYEEAKKAWKKETSSTIIPRRISCHDIKQNLENTRSKYVFIKEFSYIIDHVREYLPRGFKYAFLTREPSRVFASFRKALIKSSGFYSHRDSEVEFDMIRDDPASFRPMCWYKNQCDLWKYVKENLDPNPVIIDAFDLASEPKQILKCFCEAMGYPYSESLLQWSPSQDFPPNFVTAGEDLFETWSVFYSAAFNSTHFIAPPESGPLPRDQLTDDVIQCVDYSMPFYQEMYVSRLRVF